jgi:hypothetical protein
MSPAQPATVLLTPSWEQPHKVESITNTRKNGAHSGYRLGYVVEEEEGCYMGHTSDYVATEPWMYGKEDPCAGRGWRERTARKGQNTTGICRRDCLKGGDHGLAM